MTGEPESPVSSCRTNVRFTSGRPLGNGLVATALALTRAPLLLPCPHPLPRMSSNDTDTAALVCAALKKLTSRLMPDSVRRQPAGQQTRRRRLRRSFYQQLWWHAVL